MMKNLIQLILSRDTNSWSSSKLTGFVMNWFMPAARALRSYDSSVYAEQQQMYGILMPYFSKIFLASSTTCGPFISGIL